MLLREMEDMKDPLAPKIPSIAKGMRILLVDKDTTSLMFMASILEAFSYKVTTMEIFSIAMAIYESRKDEFDLIMANVELNNTTDLEYIKDIIRTKKTPIILMSCKGVKAIQEKEQLDGASHYFVKPLSSIQLRTVWQYAYINRSLSRVRVGAARNEQTDERVNQVEPVEVAAPVTRKSVGIQIREGGNHFRQGRDVPGAGKNKQVVAEGAPATNQTESLRKMATENNQISGGSRDRKRSGNDDNDDDDKGGRRGGRRRMNPEHYASKAGGGPGIKKKVRTGTTTSQRKKGFVRWGKELDFKFTLAISKLGEENANPKSLQEVMNIPNLSRSQIAQQLEKYKAQVQLIMDTCKASPPRAAGVPRPWRLPPPPPPAASLNLRNPGNIIRPSSGYLGPHYSGYGGQQHQGSILIRERVQGERERPPPLSTPYMGKGKQILGFQGNDTYMPPDHLQPYRPNPNPAPTYTRLTDNQEQHFPSVNPNPPPSSSLSHVAGASANPNIPAADPPTGIVGGGSESYDIDLAYLTDWLRRSLTADDAGAPTFDWSNTHMP